MLLFGVVKYNAVSHMSTIACAPESVFLLFFFCKVSIDMVLTSGQFLHSQMLLTVRRDFFYFHFLLVTVY